MKVAFLFMLHQEITSPANVVMYTASKHYGVIKWFPLSVQQQYLLFTVPWVNYHKGKKSYIAICYLPEYGQYRHRNERQSYIEKKPFQFPLCCFHSFNSLYFDSSNFPFKESIIINSFNDNQDLKYEWEFSVLFHCCKDWDYE